MVVVGGTCSGTVAAGSAPAAIPTASCVAVLATTATMQSASARRAEALWCGPVGAAAASRRLGKRWGRNSGHQAAGLQEHYCASEGPVGHRSGGAVEARSFGGRSGRGRREEPCKRVRRLLRLRGDEMDCAMPHLMDTAPFRGVCQAPSRVRDARDLIVPLAFFGFGKSKLPEVVQVGGLSPNPSSSSISLLHDGEGSVQMH